MYWWKNQRGGDCGAEASCGPASGCGPGWGRRAHRGWEAAPYGDHGEHGGGFGVRRPLRFLAYKLELDEAQVAELARILDELKTERAQVAVDDRRALSAFADALQGAAFDAQKAGDAAGLRVQSAERLKEAVVRALGKIHALLSDEQRGRLAYLIRTGTVTL
jgi:Spy/CpxP family protein refolding chaperone